MITGLDLVEWQLRVAAGEPLPCTQQQLAMRGHAIEARIYAEDADQGFTPAVGPIDYLQWPAASANVRLDAGVEQGDAIGAHYDPMVAKLIAWDHDREGARARLRDALARTRIVGCVTNVAFLARLVDAPSFAGAVLDTDLIERDAPFLAPPKEPPAREFWLLAALAQLQREAREDARAGRALGPWGARDAWRANRRGTRALQLVWHGHGRHEQRAVTVARAVGNVGADTVQLTLDGRASACRAQAQGAQGERLQAYLDDTALDATAVAHAGRWHLFVGARHEIFECRDPLAAAHPHGGPGHEHGATVLAPMPGKVVALLVEPGSHVERHAPLLIVEAMKMEHTVRAPEAGLLRSFRVVAGDQVAMGEQLMDFEADPPPAEEP